MPVLLSGSRVLAHTETCLQFFVYGNPQYKPPVRTSSTALGILMCVIHFVFWEVYQNNTTCQCAVVMRQFYLQLHISVIQSSHH